MAVETCWTWRWGRKPFIAFDLAEESDVAFDDVRFSLNRHTAQSEAEGDGTGVHAASAGQASVLGVLRDRQTKPGGDDQRGSHDVVVKDGLAVVGEAHGPGDGEGLVVREMFAHGALRGGRHGEQMDRGVALRREHPGQGLNGVIHRNGVRHGDDSGVATGGGSAGAGRDGLLPGLAWLAEMDVNIDEAGGKNKASGVDRVLYFEWR